MNKFIPLSSLKDTTGIVELCNKTGEPVVVNRNGELKLVIMTKDIFNEYFRIRKPNGELDIEKEYFGINNQNSELEAITIQKLKNPAEIVRICESIDMPFPIIRNGYDELYVMSYREYMRRKAVITFVKKTF